MNFLKTYKNYVIGVIILLLFTVLSIDKCNQTNWKNKYDDIVAVNKYKDSQIDSFKNKYNQVVTESQVQKVNDEKIIKDLSTQVFDLKKKDERHVKEVTNLTRLYQEAKANIKTEYKHDTVKIPAKDSTNYDNWVHVPKAFEKATDSFILRGRILKDSVETEITLPDTASFRIAEIKKGLFKPRETIVQSIHTNPLFQTKGIQSISVKTKVSAWNRWIKPVLVGIASGYVTYKVIK